MTVWKFGLELVDVQDVMMPYGAKLLHVDEQDGILCLWALVDPHAGKVPRTFAIVGTGNPAPGPEDAAMHVGSVVTHGGRLVWHVFERVELSA